MIAQNSHGPGDPRPKFSPAVAEVLATALREFDDTPASEASLRTALAGAAADARDQDFGPEQLVLALKAVQAEVGDASARSAEARERFHGLVLRGMLTAYFGQSGKADS